MATFKANQNIRSATAVCKASGRISRKQDQAQRDKLSITSDLPGPLPVTNARIELILGTLGATITSIFVDEA